MQERTHEKKLYLLIESHPETRNFRAIDVYLQSMRKVNELYNNKKKEFGK
jgi:hypothetical protein